jgi:hypothetical protein
VGYQKVAQRPRSTVVIDGPSNLLGRFPRSFSHDEKSLRMLRGLSHILIQGVGVA